MLNHEDLPVDLSVIVSDTEVLLEEDEDLASAALILGQLDMTEIDLKTGQPRWTDKQRALILKANDQLSEWRE